MMKILAGVEEVSDRSDENPLINHQHPQHYALNNNSHEQPQQDKLLANSKDEKVEGKPVARSTVHQTELLYVICTLYRDADIYLIITFISCFFDSWNW